MRILITGVSGFLGKHLAKSLINLGHEVLGFDVKGERELSRVRIVEGNLVTKEGFRNVPWDDLDLVYHLASLGVKPESRQWASCVEVNVLGTLNLLAQMSASKSSPHLVYTHSCYEDALKDHEALRENPYILTKSVSTSIVREFAERHKGCVVDLRVFQVYGPEDALSTVLPYICTQLLSGKQAVLGSGLGARDWIYIDDVVSGLVAAAGVGSSGKLNTYDLGSGNLITLREMAETVASIMGKTDSLVFDPANDRSDIDLKMRAINFLPRWQAQISPRDGLAALVKSYSEGS